MVRATSRSPNQLRLEPSISHNQSVSTTSSAKPPRLVHMSDQSGESSKPLDHFTQPKEMEAHAPMHDAIARSQTSEEPREKEAHAPPLPSSIASIKFSVRKA